MQTKPGYKTTEFWMTAIGMIVALLNQAFGWHIDPTAILTIAGMIASYVVSRGLTKSGQAQPQPPAGSAAIAKATALALILALAFSGCAVFTPERNAQARNAILTELYNSASGATSVSIGELTGPNAANGQDVIKAAWMSAGETAAINSLGDAVRIYGSPAVAALGEWINSKLKGVPPALRPAAEQTVAAALTNTINAAQKAPASATF